MKLRPEAEGVVAHELSYGCLERLVSEEVPEIAKEVPQPPVSWPLRYLPQLRLGRV